MTKTSYEPVLNPLQSFIGLGRVGSLSRRAVPSGSNLGAVYSSKPAGWWEQGEGEDRFIDEVEGVIR